MEKFQLIFMLCVGFLSVYNFIRDTEIYSRFGELETKQRGMDFKLNLNLKMQTKDLITKKKCTFEALPLFKISRLF